jgi:hypothetical protein
VENVNDRTPEDKLGIHTHQDGLIHIHPFQAAGAGKQATLGKFLDQVGMKASTSSIQLPAADPFDKRTYKEGETTCGGKPASVQVVHWKNAVEASTGAKPEATITSDPGKIRFSEDLGAYTLAFVAKGTTVPPPPASGEIEQKATVDSGASGAATPGASIPGDQPIPPELTASIPAEPTPAPSDGAEGSTAPPATEAP